MTADELDRSSLPSPSQDPLRLREGIQLLGRYEGSAYEQPTYLARREDGQVVHLSHLLYQVAALIDGQRDLTEIADALSTQLGRDVVVENIDFLVEKKLRPSGLIDNPADHDQEKALTRSLPLLALRYRKRVIPARVHRGVTTALQPLFWPPIVLLVLGGLVAVNVWLFGTDRSALTHAARQLPFHPNLFLLVTALVIFSGFFHELGHATATRYGGGSPGVMGVGIYLAWPAFYTDLTDSYRLTRGGRLRSDLGGVYFNAVLIVFAGIAYLLTGFGPLSVFIVVSQAMAMYQFLPFIRLDGYYIMSDLVGVPNLFAYLGPVLKSTFRRLDPVTEARLQLLKRRARVAIKVWSVVTIAFLAFNFGGIAVLAPIIIPAEWASIYLQGHVMVTAFARGDVALGVNEVLDLIVVAIAPLGMLLIASLVLRRAFRAIKKWWPTHPKYAATGAVLLVGVLLFQGQGLVTRLEASPGPAGPAVTAIKGAHRGTPVHLPGSEIVLPALPAPPSASPSPGAPVLSSLSAPVRFYVVQPNDTLWGIAAKCLGDPERWTAIFDLNAGHPQPDGRTLVDPDVIYPGWKLELPGPQPAAALNTKPTTQTDQTVAFLARPSVPPSGGTGVDTSGAAGTHTAPPTPVAPVVAVAPSAPVVAVAPSAPVVADQANPPANGQALTLADSASPVGPQTERTSQPTGGTSQPTGGTNGDATATSAQQLQPTTGQSYATTGCAQSPTACESPPDGTGQPEASPSDTTGRSTPPSTLPAPASEAPPSEGGVAQHWHPDDGHPDEDVGGGQAPTGLPDERSPPNTEGS